MRKIKIMHIVMSLEYGGAEKVAISLIKKMQGDGFSFSICALDKLGELKDELNGQVEMESLDREGLDLLLPFRLAKVIKRFKPDIIHMHNGTPLLYGAIAARLAGINKMVVTHHGSILKESGKMRFALKRISGMIDKTVAVSKDVEEYLKDTYKLNSNSLELVINGIDEEIYKKDDSKRAEYRKKFCLEDKFVIGHVARLSPEKDQETLLDAFSKVAKEIEDARLVIVGDGPLRESVERIASSAQLKNKVLFLGARNDIQDIMNIFDIFVLSSVREGTSLTLLEAMAMELPIVATNAGGNADVVRNGENGLIVPMQNPEEMAEAIIYLIKNPAIREEMGRLGRMRVVRDFSLTKMCEKYAEIYKELV